MRLLALGVFLTVVLVLSSAQAITFPPSNILFGQYCPSGPPYVCPPTKSCPDGSACITGWPEGPGTIETAPGKRDLPYIGTCMTNQMPPRDAEFSNCEAAVRLPLGPTRGGFDCKAFCRYHTDDPIIPYPPGYVWRGSSMCPPDQSSNTQVYVYGTLNYPPRIQTAVVYVDGGCDEIPGVTGRAPQPFVAGFPLVGRFFRKTKTAREIRLRKHRLVRLQPVEE